MHCHSFPPIARPDARLLILGSMPGKVSLRDQQYYAHPQNAFWKITAEILGFDPTTPYAERVAMLQSNRIALWDVLKSCTRESSLDADIEPSTIVPNDFAQFFAKHPEIRRICFNGAKAATLFARHVAPALPAMLDLELRQLPSTSPANAGVSRAEKLRAWRVIGHVD
ncbi:MAG: DNA-deoxyinosine glycosylase [Gemmatimonadetes bacterium]|nr:DNA-deoxyinosine glycosylase [Gemmatimonadota bacterium]MBK9548721.1 DNA-deoxyinosine glycosylase [Gemmatimonadota bacterium]MBP9898207.1 DNA-deoxyinosine glycosylase [Gemmatimonadales bacterium]